MIGAIIGDVVGSRFEFKDHSGKNFELFVSGCVATDDSFMTLAIANSLLLAKGNYSNLESLAEYSMKKIAADHPKTGWGGNFYKWLFEGGTKTDSFGNGAAMRISPVGWVANSEEEVKILSKKVTVPSHNHPEGIKGAEATAVAIFFARIGMPKDEIKSYIEKNYYKLDFTIDEIRESYRFNETCQETVPQALECFFESTDFEDAIRIAISLGGDSDTIGAIVGGVAEAYYGVPAYIKENAISYLDEQLYNVLKDFEKYYLDKLKY